MKDFEIVAKIKVYDIDACIGIKKKLIESAQYATQSAYAPYSKYKVGAAVLLENGEIIRGNNQENAAYPSGLCAERTALFYANASHPDQSVKMVAITAFYNGDFTSETCTPCGSCRQVLLEVENRFKTPVTILMCSKDKVYESSSAKDLLPLCFSDKSFE